MLTRVGTQSNDFLIYLLIGDEKNITGISLNFQDVKVILKELFKIKKSNIGLTAVEISSEFLMLHSLQTNQYFKKIIMPTERCSIDVKSAILQVNMIERDLYDVLLGLDPLIVRISGQEGYSKKNWLGWPPGGSTVVLAPSYSKRSAIVLYYDAGKLQIGCPEGFAGGGDWSNSPPFDELIIRFTVLGAEMKCISNWLGLMSGHAYNSTQIEWHIPEFGNKIPLGAVKDNPCFSATNIDDYAKGIMLLWYTHVHNFMDNNDTLISLQLVNISPFSGQLDLFYKVCNPSVGLDKSLALVARRLTHTRSPSKMQFTNLIFLTMPKVRIVRVLKCAHEIDLKQKILNYTYGGPNGKKCIHENLATNLIIKLSHLYNTKGNNGSNGTHDEDKLNSFLEYVMESGQVTDGTVASEPSKMYDIWQLRERIAEALLHDGYCYKYDISLPLPNFYQLVEDMRTHLGEKVFRCCGYGHVGDGNLHLNITTTGYEKDVLHLIEPFVYEWTAMRKGSISAEHGLGFKKRNYIHFSKSNSAIGLMKQMKAVMDPNGILNPYKVLPDQY
ncbi:unnamed protein product, partial [Meganyctiphanes norvegica]